MILIIGHYLNFKNTFYNKFPKLLLQKIKEKGKDYIVVNDKKEAIEKYLEKTEYIICFEELVTKNVYPFFGKEGSLQDLLHYFKRLEKKIPIYPPTRFYNMTATKKYIKYLPKRLRLPHTKVFYFHPTTIQANFQHYQKHNPHVNKMVVKCGYSGDADHVFYTTLTNMMEVIPKLQHYHQMIGRKYIVIVQPFNPVISNRLNEYRFNCINGKISRIAAFGIFKSPSGAITQIPSKELDPERNISEKNIMECAQDAFHVISQRLRYVPIYLRIDVSWAEDDEFLDEYTTMIEKKRYYINEIENLDGTFYFNCPYVPKTYPHRITNSKECGTHCRRNMKAQIDLADALALKVTRK